ncbi:hypothetical protein F442_06207 [Phytophthora nicotianae P10297]|uniref:LYC1 C-terminal domain-containing protein n=3 Tax=Phytophthora nicotianae TaxID=4792 RepID=V9FGK9_PHYNI|nr:hypothetical protein F443_06172 [Phytophthora nicotianae P1569]ETP47946.1 hypothetical protein F442_06207 [Phytophthora nicotianae P10297]
MVLINDVHYARVAGLDAYDVKTNDNAFVLWWHDLKESTLYVSRARFPDSGENAAATTRVLLNAALQEARKFKLKKVVVWDPPSGLVRDEIRRLLEIEVAERKLSLSSATVFRRGDTQEATTALPLWFCNENYEKGAS